MAQYLDGSLVSGDSLEQIAVENIKAQVRLAVFNELLNIKYEDIAATLGVELENESDPDWA